MPDFYSFKDVLKELKIDENELKKMVSEGEIRAFRSENKMKFKRDDIEKLRKEKTGVQKTADDTNVMEESAVTDINQTDDILIEELLDDSNQPQTAEPSGADHGAEIMEEGISLEDSDDDLLLEEEPLEQTGEVELPTPTEVELEPVSPSKVIKTRSSIARKKPVVIEEQRSSVLWLVILFLTTGLLFYTFFFSYEWIQYDNSSSNNPVITRSLNQWFLEKFWTDPEWISHHESKLTTDKTGAPIYPSNIMGYEAASDANSFE